MERPRGDRVLADTGARRDLSQSLAEGVAQLVAELVRRLPDVEPLIQLVEPMLPAVLAGGIPYARAACCDITRLRRARSVAPSAIPFIGSRQHLSPCTAARQSRRSNCSASLGPPVCSSTLTRRPAQIGTSREQAWRRDCGLAWVPCPRPYARARSGRAAGPWAAA